MRLTRVMTFSLLLAACGAKGGTTTPPGGEKSMDDMVLGQPCAERMLKMPDTDESKFGPLEVGADYQTYHKVSTDPFPSKTHGGRFVEVWVNDIGLQAYTTDQDSFPVGTTIVKTSWENDGGKPSQIPGPIFVMRKEAAGYLPDHDDWYYAIRWEQPTPKQLAMLGSPIYWRGHSMKVSYCYKCHDGFANSLGGIPEGFRSWEKK